MSFSDWLRLRENINPFKDKLLATATKLGGLLPNRAKPSSGSLEEKIEALLSRMFVAWKKDHWSEALVWWMFDSVDSRSVSVWPRWLIIAAAARKAAMMAMLTATLRSRGLWAACWACSACSRCCSVVSDIAWGFLLTLIDEAEESVRFFPGGRLS